MQVSKVQFSPEEFSLAENAELILTKNRVIGKVMYLFGELADDYRKITNALLAALPEQIILYSPKISRGEQYRGLPYVILDYPRIFSKDDIFAVRTFFWWGNFFSITLHLKGQYKNQLLERIVNNVQFFSQHNYSFAVSEDEWRHDFESGIFESVSGSEAIFKEKAGEKKFLKLARSWPIQQGNQIKMLLANEFEKIVNVITG
jgi:hypothetical protein